MYLLVVCILSIGLYALVTNFITVPTFTSAKALLKIKKKQSSKEQIYISIIYPLSKLLAVFIKIDDYKRVKLKRNLSRANIPLTPEEYYAKAIVTSVLVILSALIFIPLGIPVLTLTVFALGVILFFKEIQSVDDKLKHINNQILKELPRFIRTYNHSCGSKVSVVDVIEKYRDVAGKYFRYDLDVLITDLKTGNEELALQKFDDRVNIPQLSTFVSGVIGTSKGIDQKTFFYLMEKDMKVLAKENLKKEISKRPAKIRKATIAVGVMLFIVYLYPIALDLKTGLGIFN